MIVLDTQHVSQLQLTGTDSATRLVSRLQALRNDELRLTIITPFEQLRECLGRINASASRPTSQLAHYDRLSRILDFYAAWNARILPFNQAAADVLGRFPPS